MIARFKGHPLWHNCPDCTYVRQVVAIELKNAKKFLEELKKEMEELARRREAERLRLEEQEKQRKAVIAKRERKQEKNARRLQNLNQRGLESQSRKRGK